MKHIFTFLLIAYCLSGCKVNRYYFIAEEKIPLYEFASFSGMPADTAQVGDTIYSTGQKVMAIGGTVPVEFGGFQFYTPSAKARLIRQTKVDPKKDASISGVVYTPRKEWKDLAQKYKQDSLYWAEQDQIVWYGQVTRAVEVLASDYSIAKPIYKLQPNSIIKINRHSYNYWLVEVNGMKGYLPVESISYYSKTANPFVRTSYTGRTYDPGSSPLTSTPTTGATIRSGPRGGRYYINSNGNKTYVPRNGSYGGGRRK